MGGARGSGIMRTYAPRPFNAVAFLAILSCVAFLHGLHLTFGGISVELSDAPDGPTPHARVFRWLQAHRGDLAMAERTYKIDRRAVAAVIAYEALENVHNSYYFGLTRSAGPGKVHFKGGYVFEGDPLSRQAEELGYLPRRTVTERRHILESAGGSIAYISAIMARFARIAAGSGYSITCNSPALVTFYSAWDFDRAREWLRLKSFPNTLRPNRPGHWAAEELTELTAVVGKPSRATCSTKNGEYVAKPMILPSNV